LDLTVKVTDLQHSAINPALYAVSAGTLPICDRCQKVDEVVVAIMQILPLEQTWALCGPCKQKLPIGFHIA
jgi:hypothetical protein